MTKIRVKSTYEIITTESAERGDFEETGWLDEEGQLFDSADEVARHLSNEGVIEPSSSCFHRGVWYTTEADVDYRTMAEERRSYHIEGATLGQERRIYRKLFPKYGDCR